jgi:hypothetical protein
MKRTKYQSTVRQKAVRLDSPESHEEIHCSGTKASTWPFGDVRYHLRTRTILDLKTCENRDKGTHILDKKDSISQTKYSPRKVVTENFRGRPPTHDHTFTQQLQTSTDITHSINECAECGPNIMKLPNEVLTMIFSYLDIRELSISVAPVCRHWYVIAHSPVLWRKLCLKGDGISTENAKCLLTKSPLLSELIISNR